MSLYKKCCGNCQHFKDEDANGFGLCCKDGVITQCDTFCSDYSSLTNGWTETTPDNVKELYKIQVNRLVIAWIHGEMTLCRMYHDTSPSLGLMAKIGGYYYMELPELKYGTK